MDAGFEEALLLDNGICRRAAARTLVRNDVCIRRVTSCLENLRDNILRIAEDQGLKVKEKRIAMKFMSQ